MVVPANIAELSRCLRKNPFVTYMINSTVVAVVAVGVSLLVGLPAAYAIARYKRKSLGC